MEGDRCATDPLNEVSRRATSPVELRGIFPIVYTPFDADGRIDEEDLERLIEHLIAAGVHGLAAVGGASECTYDAPHRADVARRAHDALRTRTGAHDRRHLRNEYRRIRRPQSACPGDRRSSSLPHAAPLWRGYRRRAGPSFRQRRPRSDDPRDGTRRTHLRVSPTSCAPHRGVRALSPMSKRKRRARPVIASPR